MNAGILYTLCCYHNPFIQLIRKSPLIQFFDRSNKQNFSLKFERLSQSHLHMLDTNM